MARAMCRTWKLNIAKMSRDYAKSSPNRDGRIPTWSVPTARLPRGSLSNTQ
jgi:hypothetical protein